MNLTKEDWTIYVPEYAGNRDDKEENQMTVEIHSLDAGEARAYARKLAAKMKNGQDVKRIAEVSEESTREVFLKNVRNIRGFSLNGTAIEDVPTFFDKAPIQLVQEIATAIEDASHLDEGRRDRSTLPSGG